MTEYEVTGVRYQMGDGLTMDEMTQKAKEFIRGLKNGTPLILMAEPYNPSHDDAIAVYMNYTRQVGYIKRESCKEVKQLLDADGQCDAVVSGNDGHVTFYVEIPNAPELIESPCEDTRKLPECPLPKGIGLSFSKEERSLEAVAKRLVKCEVSAVKADVLLDMAEKYMPLSRLSLCYEDDYWRDHVLKQLRKACKLKLPQSQKDRLDELRLALHDTVGDFHRTHEHWQQKVFDNQLYLLKKQAESENGLFAIYEKYTHETKVDQTDIIASLAEWFEKMPHVELRNYKDHHSLAQRLNYMGVSRCELYDVYSAILLLDKYGKTTPKKGYGKKDSDEKPPKPRETMTFKRKGSMTEPHLLLLYMALTKEQWIDGNDADFKALFSGSRDEDCELVWLGKYGKGTLVELFKQMVGAGLIEVPQGFTLSAILEGHFKDKNGQWLTGLDKGDAANDKAMPVIKECIKQMKTDPQRLLNGDYEEDDDFRSEYDRFDQQDMHWHKQ